MEPEGSLPHSQVPATWAMLSQKKIVPKDSPGKRFFCVNIS